MKNKSSNKSGFTLIEMVTVLVVVALVAGGVFVGSDLIRSFKVNSVVKDINKYKTFTNIFREKYDALPGDFKDATLNFSGSEVHNGDGDNRVEQSNAENFYFWIHLSKAEISDFIPNLQGGIGNQMPSSKISNVGYYPYFGWFLMDGNDEITNDPEIIKNSRHRFYFYAGNASVTYGDDITVEAITYDYLVTNLTPMETYNLDMKMDDGKPLTGKMLAYNNFYGPCFNGAEYNYSEKKKYCSFDIEMF